MTTATLSIDRRNGWTGTRGNTPTITIVHAPNSETDKKIARSALEFTLDHLGTEAAQTMTLGEMIQRLVDHSMQN
jgi:hypothetical protein